MLALGISHSPKLLVAWPVLLGVGITFSCIALIFNALAKGYDFFTYYFTLFLTPMMFLRASSSRASSCRRGARHFHWLPLTNAVELVRPLFMDQWPEQPWRHLAVLAAFAVVSFWVALALTRKRFPPQLRSACPPYYGSAR
jgi:lipooligosaccharide transport system permease protein